jgi:hypothetical protein
LTYNKARQASITNEVLEMIGETVGKSVGEANLQLPPPVTDVKDVIGQVGSFNKIVDGANQ